MSKETFSNNKNHWNNSYYWINVPQLTESNTIELSKDSFAFLDGLRSSSSLSSYCGNRAWQPIFWCQFWRIAGRTLITVVFFYTVQWIKIYTKSWIQCWDVFFPSKLALIESLSVVGTHPEQWIGAYLRTTSPPPSRNIFVALSSIFSQCDNSHSRTNHTLQTLTLKYDLMWKQIQRTFNGSIELTLHRHHRCLKLTNQQKSLLLQHINLQIIKSDFP